MRSRPASPPRSFLMAPRWLDGLADVLGTTDAPCYVMSEALAEEVTGFHVHRGALASLERRPLPTVDEVLAGARSVLVLEDIVDHTNVGAIFRCGAALGFDAVLLAPRCADPLYRRSIKVAMGAVFSMPWTRLAGLVRRAAGRSPPRGFTTVALTLADDADRRSRRRSPGSTGWRWCSAPRATGSRRAGSRPPTAGRSSRCARASTRSTSPPPPRSPATSPPGAEPRGSRPAAAAVARGTIRPRERRRHQHARAREAPPCTACLVGDAVAELDQRLSDELDLVNARATAGTAPARELTVRLLDDDGEARCRHERLDVGRRRGDRDDLGARGHPRRRPWHRGCSARSRPRPGAGDARTSS